MDKTQFEARLARAKAHKANARKAEILDKIVGMMGVNRAEDLPGFVNSLHKTIDEVLLTMFTEQDLVNAHFGNKVALLGKMPGRIEALRASTDGSAAGMVPANEILPMMDEMAAGFEAAADQFHGKPGLEDAVESVEALAGMVRTYTTAIRSTHAMEQTLDKVKAAVEPTTRPGLADVVLKPSVPQPPAVVKAMPQPPVLPNVQVNPVTSRFAEPPAAPKPVSKAEYRVVLDRTDIQSGDPLTATVEGAPDYAEVEWHISLPKLLTGSGGNYKAGNVNHATQVLIGAIVWVDGQSSGAKEVFVTIHPKKNGKTNGVPPLVKGSDDVLRPRTGQAPTATNGVRRFIEE